MTKFLVFLMLLTLPTFAAQASSGDINSSDESKMTVAIKGGTTFANSSSYSVTIGSLSPSSSTDTGKVSPAVGGEFLYKLLPYLQLGAAIEWNQYKYSNGWAADNELGFFALPRLQLPENMLKMTSGKFIPWLGIGLGTIVTMVGNTSSTITTGITETLDSTSAGFGISPRLGADYLFSKMFLIGLEMQYTVSWATLKGNLNEYGQNLAISESSTRKWVAAYVRFGMIF